MAVVSARELYSTSTLAELYAPLAMPRELSIAHVELDKAVEKCYRPEPFRNDRDRVEFLFKLYEQITAPLVNAGKPAKKRKAISTQSSSSAAGLLGPHA